MYLRLLVLMPIFLLLSACRESPEGASDKPVAATVQAKTPSSSPPPTAAKPAQTLESLVRADDTLPSVRARLGEAAVMAVELPGPEGESASGWRLYPYEEARTVEVWLNETGRPQAIFVRGSKSDWVRADVFQRLFEACSDEPDLEYAMVDATIVKVHRHGQGAKGGLRARPSAARKAA